MPDTGVTDSHAGTPETLRHRRTGSAPIESVWRRAALAAKSSVVGDAVNAQGLAACVTGTAIPPTLMLPWRSVVVRFGAT